MMQSYDIIHTLPNFSMRSNILEIEVAINFVWSEIIFIFEEMI